MKFPSLKNGLFAHYEYLFSGLISFTHDVSPKLFFHVKIKKPSLSRLIHRGRLIHRSQTRVTLSDPTQTTLDSSFEEYKWSLKSS